MPIATRPRSPVEQQLGDTGRAKHGEDDDACHGEVGHPIVSVADHPLHQVDGVLRASLLAADQPKAPPDLRAALAALDRYWVAGLPPPVPPAASGVGQDSRWPEPSLAACRDDTRPLARHRRRQADFVRMPPGHGEDDRDGPASASPPPYRWRPGHAARPGHHDRGDPGAPPALTGTTNRTEVQGDGQDPLAAWRGT
jgi:hypothetical protein